MNADVVPGSLLTAKGLWQQLADSFPAGTVLVVVPTADSPQRRALESTALLLAAAGCRVAQVPAEQFRQHTAIQGRLALG
jgi:hypothetical protein